MKRELFCLLIDDDPEDHEIFEMALNGIDPSIRLDYASSGMAALEKLRDYTTQLPDYIFLDLNMQIMNGKECLVEIKKIAKVADIPVIIYSTTLNENIIYETLVLGAFDHIQKPNKLEDLDGYLKRIFQIEEAS